MVADMKRVLLSVAHRLLKHDGFHAQMLAECFALVRIRFEGEQDGQMIVEKRLIRRDFAQECRANVGNPDRARGQRQHLIDHGQPSLGWIQSTSSFAGDVLSPAGKEASASSAMACNSWAVAPAAACTDMPLAMVER